MGYQRRVHGESKVYSKSDKIIEYKQIKKKKRKYSSSVINSV